MRFLRPLLALLLLAGCGSKPAPASNAPTAASSDPASSAAASKGGPDSSTAKPTIDSQREPFMQSCMTKANAPDYCDCAWGQFRDVFKDADLTKQPGPDDPRFATLREKTVSACAAKVPEDHVKTDFLSSCASGDKRKDAYCACAWTSLRKKLSVADFVATDFTGPRFDDAKKAMVAACKGKLPAEVAKADFMAGCTRDDSGRSKPCECLWKKLKGKFTTEEIAAGLANLREVPGVEECK